MEELNELKAILEDDDQNENHVQDYLERHSDLIPRPFLLNHGLHLNVVVSKPTIGPHKADFLYLTKSSQEWWIVIIEIERQSKQLFTSNTASVQETSEFTQAMGQLRSWQEYVRTNQANLRSSVQPLLKPVGMDTNPISFRYVLVMGRSDEFKIGGAPRRERLKTYNSAPDCRVMTYDSLMSEAHGRHKKRKHHAPPAVPAARKTQFVCKYLHLPTLLFAQLGPAEIQLDANQEASLKAKGYDIDSWKNGKLLSSEGKLPLGAGVNLSKRVRKS